MSTLSVIIPTFNNANCFRSKIYDINKSFKNLTQELEIIIVDDGSDAYNKNEIKNIATENNFHFIYLDRNMGKGAAIQKGVEFSKGEFIIFCDSDFPFLSEDIESIFNSITTNNYDLVIGDRRKSFSATKSNFGKSRIFLSKTYNFLSHLILQIGDYDNQCGLKAFKKHIAKKLFKNLVTKRYSFDAEIVYRSKFCAYKIHLIPIKLQKNGKSSLKIFKDGFKMCFDLINIRLKSLTKMENN